VTTPATRPSVALSGIERRQRMQAIREAFVLPIVFLTVTLGGGFRASPATGHFQFVQPPLVHLVLAVLVLAVLVRSGVLEPSRVLSARRTELENACGVVVVAALFAASAEVIHAVVPDAGLWHLLGVLVLALLLGNTIAIRPDPIGALQSLLVSLGGMLVVKHVVVTGLADPQRGLARRILTALLEGVTLGELHVEPAAPVTGYVAFGTVLLYLFGLLMLWRSFPRDQPSGGALVPRVAEESVLDVHAGGLRQAQAREPTRYGEEALALIRRNTDRSGHRRFASSVVGSAFRRISVGRLKPAPTSDAMSSQAIRSR
jgi:hypothetical protein